MSDRLRAMELIVEGTNLGKFVAFRVSAGQGFEFQGTDGVRRWAGKCAVEFRDGRPRKIVVSQPD